MKAVKTSMSIGVILINFSVAAYLFATGIIGLSGKSFKNLDGGEIRKAVDAVFGKGDLSNALVVILAILAIAAGVFILLKMFSAVIPMTELILIILALAWLAFIVMIDIISPLNSRNKPEFIDWLRVCSSHLIVLAGIVLATERFGWRK